MRAAQAVSLIRKLAREKDLNVIKLKKRGKGSHQMYALLNADGVEVERFGVTDHPGDMGWIVTTRLEERLAPLFGDKWMEKK
jgi:hypothetical protein